MGKRSGAKNGFFNWGGLFGIIGIFWTAVVVLDIVFCNFNPFFRNQQCPSGPGGGGSGNNQIVTPAQNNNNSNQNSGPGTGGNSVVGGICSSAPNPVCGIVNQGTLVNGVCNATIPPNSACPAPIIALDRGFYADPSLVKSGNQTNLYWNVTNATTCGITGGGLNIAGLGIMGVTLSSQITQKTTFTLACLNGVGGPSATANVTVNLVPAFDEI